MKALSLVGIFLAAFLIFLGFTTREKSDAILGNAAMIGGTIILIFVAAAWILAFIKNKKEQDKGFDDFDT